MRGHTFLPASASSDVNSPLISTTSESKGSALAYFPNFFLEEQKRKTMIGVSTGGRGRGQTKVSEDFVENLPHLAAKKISWQGSSVL